MMENAGKIKLRAKKIFQSTDIINKLKIVPIIGNTLRPAPNLIRFFSKKLSDSLTNLHNVKPKPNVYKKNNIMLAIAISYSCIEERKCI